MTSERHRAFWRRLMEPIGLDHPWVTESHALAVDCEKRRKGLPAKHGTITGHAALYLRAVAAWSMATVAIEIGTFIGHSTLTIRKAVPTVYTCDATQGRLPKTSGVIQFAEPSTKMLSGLVSRGDVRAGFFFVDGLMDPADPELMIALSEPDAIYVFDDYFLGGSKPDVKPSRKGIVNAAMLQFRLPGYELVLPMDPLRADVTLAALVPEERL